MIIAKQAKPKKIAIFFVSCWVRFPEASGWLQEETSYWAKWSETGAELSYVYFVTVITFLNGVVTEVL